MIITQRNEPVYYSFITERMYFIGRPQQIVRSVVSSIYTWCSIQYSNIFHRTNRATEGSNIEV